MRGSHKLLTTREQKKRIKLYRKGYNDNQIAIKVDRTREAICQWRKKLKLNSNSIPKASPRKLNKRMRLYKRGYKDRDIANAQGVNPMCIVLWRYRRRLSPN